MLQNHKMASVSGEQGSRLHLVACQERYALERAHEDGYQEVLLLRRVSSQ